MSQPKHRRRAARRRARAEQASRGRSYVHISTTGTLRNQLGKVSPLGRVIGVGFGSATVSRDGVLFVDGERPRRRGAGRSRWVAAIRAPLWDATWERQRPGKWVCVAAGEGFA